MYLINEVSKKVRLSQKRIREYEKEGFVRPQRAPYTNNRLYTDFDVAQIKRINHLIHKRGFTLACLKNLLVLAPCWKVFNCRNYVSCPAYQNPHEPCWEVRRRHDSDAAKGCQKCAIFVNRSFAREKLLEKETDSW